ETYDYTPEDERDCGIEVRREARKISALLHDPTFLDMRSYAEGEHLSRQASMHRQEATEPFERGFKTSLRRRGALMGFRKLDRSDITAASSWDSSNDSNRTLADTAPVTVRQKVKTAISDTIELNAAIDNIKDIARQTTCPADFLDIMEAILESLVSDDNNRHWGQVLRAIVLLRQCLSNVSNDVAAYFHGNEEVMRLLYGFNDLGDLDLLGRTANAVRNSFSSTNEKEPLDPLDASPVVRAPYIDVPEKAPLDPPAYAILNPDEPAELSDEENEPESRRESAPIAYQLVRPLPTLPVPVDWSRLFTVASGQRTPSVSPLEADRYFQDRRVSESGTGLVTGYPRRLPPRPVVTPESSEDFPEESLPSYATAIESPPAEHLPSGVMPSPVTTLVDLESEEDIEYVDEVLDTLPEPVPMVPPLDFATTEGPVIPGAMDHREIVRITPSTETFSQNPAEIIPPPTSNQNDEGVRPDPFLLSTRPSISLAVSPPPRVLATPGNTFDSPDATSSSTSSSPPSSSLVRCLTGLVRRGTEPACARGGFSDVWKGKLKSRIDSDEEEDVAIKVLRAVRIQSDGCPINRMHKRMTRETSIWGRLVHPNVVPLRGYSLDEDGTPAIVSRWMDNGDVLTYLARHHFADRRKLVRQVAEGLLYLHSQKPPVVHGDLKGGNVLIDRDGDAALCDFGMATFLMDCQPINSTSNAAVGTVRWCAP
ncbi:hypothetical protein FRC00_009934, partial [Tulasnella sp. 408]